MIKINQKQFRSINFEDCINQSINPTTDAFIKRTVDFTISSTKRKSKFNQLTDEEKVEYFLKHTLMKIVPSANWLEYSNEQEGDYMKDLYTSLKRHYFLATDSFPI